MFLGWAVLGSNVCHPYEAPMKFTFKKLLFWRFKARLVEFEIQTTLIVFVVLLVSYLLGDREFIQPLFELISKVD